MVKTLEQAIVQISRLPDADQEQIGRRLLSHIEKLNALRAEIDKAIVSLDEGKGGALDIEIFLRRKNSGHGGHRSQVIWSPDVDRPSTYYAGTAAGVEGSMGLCHKTF